MNELERKRLNVEQADYLNMVYDDIEFRQILKDTPTTHYKVLKRVIYRGQYIDRLEERNQLTSICEAYVTWKNG